MHYRVSIYDDTVSRWLLVGPEFTSREEAETFLGTFATSLKRLAQLDTEQPEREPIDLTGLDLAHLEFAKYLVQAGLVTDVCEETDGMAAVG